MLSESAKICLVSQDVIGFRDAPMGCLVECGLFGIWVEYLVDTLGLFDV